MSTVLECPSLDIGTTDFDDFTPMNQEAFIEVRHAASFGVGRTFEISIDDHRVGQVGRSSPGRYRVSPGRHTLAARMDWVRTQTVTVYLHAGERAVFRCGMEVFAARLWSIALILLVVVVGVAGVSILLKPILPGHVRDVLNVFAVCCGCPMGLCELIVFSRMTPWSAPGRVMRLFRLPFVPGSPPA